MLTRNDKSRIDWRAGATAGVIGGICYTLFVEAVNVAANGWGSFFFPFRQIGAVILGPAALRTQYNVWTAVSVGAVVHFAIAAAFGIALTWIASRFRLGAVSLITIGLVAALVFYAVDVFLIFPAAFPWFLDNSRLTQSVGHAIFGAATGAWLSRGFRR